ncbi:MAG: porin family protein [Parafilimonas sp.]
MKKIITLAAVIICILTAASAQKARFGFNGGLTLSSYKTKVEGETFTSKSKTGFTAGIFTDVTILKNLSFQPALQYTQKGGVDKESLLGDDYKLTLTMNYLEIPFNFLYKFNSANTRFYIGGGPVLSFGLSGQLKVSAGGEHDKADLHFGKTEDDDLKQVDRGANILAGFEFKSGVSITFNYNMSFSNLVIDGDKNNYFHNGYAGVRLGYVLKEKKK